MQHRLHRRGRARFDVDVAHGAGEVDQRDAHGVTAGVHGRELNAPWSSVTALSIMPALASVLWSPTMAPGSGPPTHPARRHKRPGGGGLRGRREWKQQ